VKTAKIVYYPMSGFMQ